MMVSLSGGKRRKSAAVGAPDLNAEVLPEPLPQSRHKTANGLRNHKILACWTDGREFQRPYVTDARLDQTSGLTEHFSPSIPSAATGTATSTWSIESVRILDKSIESCRN